jgi:glycine/D-amino acid oxidase-like deaminating enzyme/nitrite reductase/ring-hydroxylating ferredoxin subunit
MQRLLTTPTADLPLKSCHLSYWLARSSQQPKLTGTGGAATSGFQSATSTLGPATPQAFGSVTSIQYQPLQQASIPRESFDVCVIGAGITGLTCATQLKRAGKRVAVLESGIVACGTTGYSTGHLTNVVDTRYSAISKSFDKGSANLVLRGLTDAIDLIEGNVRTLKIECGFERLPGYLYAEPSQDDKEVKEEFTAMHDLGASVQLIVDKTSIGLPFDVKTAFRAPNLAQFNPADYCRGLAGFVHGDGCSVFEGTRVRELKQAPDGVVVFVDGGASLSCRNVVMATHTPIGLDVALQTRLFPKRSYVIAIKVSNPPAAGIYWDTAEPYNYIRTASAHERDVLIIGGCDHKSGQPTLKTERAHMEKLEQYARERFQIVDWLGGWSAQYYDTPDGLPYIGNMPMKTRVWVAAGFAGDGLTWGSLAGSMLSDMVSGVPNIYADLYAPSRIKPLASAKEFISENLNVAKHLVMDRFHTDAASLSEVPIGGGRLVQSGTHKVAAYRDQQGVLHACSAVCTHMGCIVKFNSSEVSWDCPCHGTRYSVDGKVLEGPALTDLEDLSTKIPKQELGIQGGISQMTEEALAREKQRGEFVGGAAVPPTAEIPTRAGGAGVSKTGEA